MAQIDATSAVLSLVQAALHTDVGVQALLDGKWRNLVDQASQLVFGATDIIQSHAPKILAPAPRPTIAEA